MAAAKRTSTGKGKKPRQKRAQRPPAPSVHISTDAALDALGYTLMGIALLTVLALLSAQRGTVLGSWLRFLGQMFGWGTLFVPIFAGAVGFYLVLRRFGDRVPRPQPEQVAGAILLFLAFVTTAHFVGLWVTRLPGVAMAEAGQGGGLLGLALGDALVQGLGGAGAALVLLTVWAFGFFFVLGVSPAEMVRWVEEQVRQRQRAPVSRPSPPSPARPESRPEPRHTPEPVPPQVPAPTPARPAPTAPAPTAAAPPPARPTAVVPPRPRVIGGETRWELPRVEEILEPGSEQDFNQDLIRQQVRIIEETLASLGAPVKVKEINRGPVVTQFGVEPLFVANSRGKETRVKVSKIVALADDLALALSAKTVRIQAPVPNKGLVGIEVPNEEVALVALRDIMESEAWEKVKSPLRLALGQDVSGAPYVADLRRDAPSAHRRDHGLREICLHQRDFDGTTDAEHTGRPETAAGGPETGGTDTVQRHPPSAGPSGGGHGAGGGSAAVGPAGDGQPLPAVRQRGRAGYCGLQRADDGSRFREQPDSLHCRGHRRVGRPDDAGAPGDGEGYLSAGPDGPRRGFI